MISPTMMKKGTANRGKEEALVINRCNIKSGGVPVDAKVKYARAAAMSANAIGMLEK